MPSSDEASTCASVIKTIGRHTNLLLQMKGIHPICAARVINELQEDLELEFRCKFQLRLRSKVRLAFRLRCGCNFRFRRRLGFRCRFRLDALMHIQITIRILTQT